MCILDYLSQIHSKYFTWTSSSAEKTSSKSLTFLLLISTLSLSTILAGSFSGPFFPRSSTFRSLKPMSLMSIFHFPPSQHSHDGWPLYLQLVDCPAQKITSSFNTNPPCMYATRLPGTGWRDWRRARCRPSWYNSFVVGRCSRWTNEQQYCN